MTRDDDFEEFRKRGRKRLGMDDPDPEPPEPLGRSRSRRPLPERPRSLTDSRETSQDDDLVLGEEDFRSRPAQPQQPPSSPPSKGGRPRETGPAWDDDFWRKVAAGGRPTGAKPRRGAGPVATGDTEIDQLIARIAGRVGPTPEFVQELKESGKDTDPPWPTRHWVHDALRELDTIAESDHSRARLVLEGMSRVMEDEDDGFYKWKRETFLAILMEAANPAPTWTAAGVPSDMWGLIKRGQVKSDLVNHLAQPLLEVTEQPGLEWHIFVTGMDFAVFDEVSRSFINEWYSQRTWPVWNFRNWQDLRAFEGRINQALKARLDEEWSENKGYRLFYDVKGFMYGDDVDTVMEIYSYAPSPSGQWEWHPGISEFVDDMGSLIDPPFIKTHDLSMHFSHHYNDWSYAEGEGQPIPQELLELWPSKEAMMEHYGHRWAVLAAKQMALQRVQFLREGIRVAGL